MTSNRPRTILVADGNDQMCEFIEVVLYRVGYHVLTAQSGADALRLARNTPKIDLLVSDLEIPPMRGDKLASQLSCLHPAARVLFVSGSYGPINTAQPFEFLAKPFTIAELRDAVQRTLHAVPAFNEGYSKCRNWRKVTMEVEETILKMVREAA